MFVGVVIALVVVVVGNGGDCDVLTFIIKLFDN